MKKKEWGRLFYKILHHPRGLKSLTKEEHQKLDDYFKFKFNQTLWGGQRIVRIQTTRDEVLRTLKGQIIGYYLKGKTHKAPTLDKLMSFSASELFEKIDGYAYNFLHYHYVKKHISKPEDKVGDAGSIPAGFGKTQKDEDGRKEETKIDEQAVSLSEAKGEDDGVSAIEKEARLKTAEDFKDAIKKRPNFPGLKQMISQAAYDKATQMIGLEHNISRKAAELKREMDLSARKKNKWRKRR